jgi:hypothetical protein
VQAFIQATQARLLNFAQCQLSADFQKYTTLLVTQRWMMAAGKALSAFDNNPCRCMGKHRLQATGRDEQGNYYCTSRHVQQSIQLRWSSRLLRHCWICSRQIFHPQALLR